MRPDSNVRFHAIRSFLRVVVLRSCSSLCSGRGNTRVKLDQYTIAATRRVGMLCWAWTVTMLGVT